MAQMNMTCREHYALTEENVQPDREQLHDETNNANCILENGEPLLEILTTLQIDSDGDCSSSSTKENGIWCSKNALRKKRHWEKIVAAKKSKRKLEKEKKKAKQAENSNAGTNPQQHSKRFLKAITKERVLGAKDSGPRLCVDLSMTMHMSRKEISRLAAQIRRLYGSNKKAAKPFWLYLTEKIIYLTPDSDNALKDIDPQKVYVLGGLVDESIQKKLTYHKARENGLQTARLPIPEYMVKNVNLKNFHSEILAINQVFDVLATYLETQSWPDALKAGVPPGKGFFLRDSVK
ncbi:tRNA methyltransferase 10 homolog B isoform X2 [Pelobates fuscus]|uniref:tRNA methyltransferase 10 homolog B isoform X2 n=1 Tax=Pelobates fuscus TaxID=191477 RepID=UPI002FE4B446